MTTTHQKQSSNQGKEATRKRRTPRPTNQGPVVTALQADLGVLQRAVANPGLASSDDILSLQRAYGNRAVSGLLTGASYPIQAKSALRVGPVGDQYEQEADQVAERVMTMSIPTSQPPVQRQGEEDELLQGKPLAASITPIVRRQVDEEELLQGKSTLQRQFDEEELLQGKSTVQRQGDWDEDEDLLQGKPTLQRQIEDEELLQGKSTLQRQIEDEEPLQGKSTLQRQIEDEELLQGKSTLQRQIEDEELLQGKSTLQRQIDEEELLQGKATIRRAATDDGFQVDGNVEERLSAQRGRGSSLPDEVRTDMEARFGTDFGQVRVHADTEADELGQALRARAFTHGVDVYFAAGQDDFGSSDGKRLLAHELTHVVQQTGGQSSPVTHSRPQAVQGDDTVQRSWLSKLFGKKKKTPEQELEKQLAQIQKLMDQAGEEGPLDMDKLDELIGQAMTTTESLELESRSRLEEEQEKFDRLYEDFQVKQQVIDEGMEDIFGMPDEEDLTEIGDELGIDLGEDDEDLTEDEQIEKELQELGFDPSSDEDLTDEEQVDKLMQEMQSEVEKEEEKLGLTPEEKELAKALGISGQEMKDFGLSPEEIKDWLKMMSEIEEEEKKPEQKKTLGGREDLHEKELAWELPEEKPKETPVTVENLRKLLMDMTGGGTGMGSAMASAQMDPGLLSDILDNVANLAARVAELEKKESE